MGKATRRTIHAPVAGTARLLIDVINDLAFDGSVAWVRAERMATRDLAIFVPADCILSNTATDNDHALRQICVVLKGNIEPFEKSVRPSSRQRISRPGVKKPALKKRAECKS
jgi:hypothetical protein